MFIPVKNDQRTLAEGPCEQNDVLTVNVKKKLTITLFSYLTVLGTPVTISNEINLMATTHLLLIITISQAVVV